MPNRYAPRKNFNSEREGLLSGLAGFFNLRNDEFNDAIIPNAPVPLPNNEPVINPVKQIVANANADAMNSPLPVLEELNPLYQQGEGGYSDSRWQRKINDEKVRRENGYQQGKNFQQDMTDQIDAVVNGGDLNQAGMDSTSIANRIDAITGGPTSNSAFMANLANAKYDDVMSSEEASQANFEAAVNPTKTNKKKVVSKNRKSKNKAKTADSFEQAAGKMLDNNWGKGTAARFNSSMSNDVRASDPKPSHAQRLAMLDPGYGADSGFGSEW